MLRIVTTIVECPNCGGDVPWDSSSKWKPFCCERCRLIDLGEWLDEEKRIPEHQGPGNDFQEEL